MPKNRTLLALALLLAAPLPFLAFAQEKDRPAAAPTAGAPATGAAPAKEGAAAPPTEAEKTLDEAIKKVSALTAVSADLTENVEMLGEKFRVEGRYLKAPGNRVLLDLAVKGLPDSDGRMRQVCDGTTLWDYQQVFETKIYRKFLIAEILEKLKSPELDANLRDQVTAQLGIAGPDILLIGLRKAIAFTIKEDEEGPESARKPITIDGKAVWLLTGEWKDRTGLLGPNQQPLPPLVTLPSYIPSAVKLYIGKEDGWPYKVSLVGTPKPILEDTRPTGPDGRKIGPISMIQKPLLTRIELSYLKVALNPKIEDKEFAWQPPAGASVEDSTQAILNGLEQAMQVKAAQKKAEAAGKSENGILKQSIDVPSAPAETTAPPVAPALPANPTPANTLAPRPKAG